MLVTVMGVGMRQTLDPQLGSKELGKSESHDVNTWIQDKKVTKSSNWSTSQLHRNVNVWD